MSVVHAARNPQRTPEGTCLAAGTRGKEAGQVSATRSGEARLSRT